jgi:hypothetical protein
VDSHDFSAISNGSDHPQRGNQVHGLANGIGSGGRDGANETDSLEGGRGGDEVSGERAGVLDDSNPALDVDPESCAAYISLGNFGYLPSDPERKSDDGDAHSLDAEFAASEIIRQLENGLPRDVAYILLSCRRRLKSNPQDLFARTLLGLALLMLRNETEAFHELQRVFLQSPVWRPFLRQLVNRVKQRRANVDVRALRSS